MAVIVNLVRTFQFIEHRRNRLTRGRGEAANVLVRKERAEQGFKPDFAALLARRFLEEFDDAGAGVLKGQGFDALFGTT